MSKIFGTTLSEIKGAVDEQRRIRSLLAAKIVATRRSMREDWSVPPQYLHDRIEVLREIGRAIRQ